MLRKIWSCQTVNGNPITATLWRDGVMSELYGVRTGGDFLIFVITTFMGWRRLAIFRDALLWQLWREAKRDVFLTLYFISHVVQDFVCGRSFCGTGGE